MCPGKTLTAPLDRVKLLLQTRGGFAQGSLKAAAKKGNVLEALLAIGRQEGFRGYWKGNLPQVIHLQDFKPIADFVDNLRGRCEYLFYGSFTLADLQWICENLQHYLERLKVVIG